MIYSLKGNTGKPGWIGGISGLHWQRTYPLIVSTQISNANNESMRYHEDALTNFEPMFPFIWMLLSPL